MTIASLDTLITTPVVTIAFLIVTIAILMMITANFKVAIARIVITNGSAVRAIGLIFTQNWTMAMSTPLKLCKLGRVKANDYILG